MRVLVCGGRDFDDWGLLDDVLDTIRDNGAIVITIIEGGATGADFLAKVWAKYRRVKYEEYPAQWELYGKSAGYKRNAEMLEAGKPDIVIAFPGGKGTQNMIDQAEKAGVPVRIIH